MIIGMLLFIAKKECFDVLNVTQNTPSISEVLFYKVCGNTSQSNDILIVLHVFLISSKTVNQNTEWSFVLHSEHQDPSFEQ